MAEQLALLHPPRCRMCGEHHDGPPRPTCGYDPEMVRPAMSIAEAMSLVIDRAVKEHGIEGACERIPGLYVYGEVCKPCFTGIGECLGCITGERKRERVR